MAKDIMAFANTEGGHIIIGVKEDKAQNIFTQIGVADGFKINDITLKTKLKKYLNMVPKIGVCNHFQNGMKFTVIYISLKML